MRKFGRSPVNLVEEPPKPDSWFDTDIEFDRDTNVTTIHVCSIFVNVPEPKGEEFILFAEPALWAERAEFFRASTPGRWDSEREIFDVDDWWLRAMQEFKPSEAPLTTDLARQLVPAWRQYASEYFIFEHAEWEWSPEETGGIMNELKIGREEPPVDQFSEMLSAVYRKLAAEAKKTRRELEKENKARSHDSQRAEVNRLDLFEATQNQIALHQLMAEFPAENAHATHSIRFAYKLHRSLQSRFLSSWVRGGLSIDDGTYEAAWFPKDEQGGLLCIRADKKIHFTRRADVFEDYSKLLNLLAPSLASMLMEELAYQGVLEFLEEEGAAGFGRPTTPPVSRVLGSTRHSAAVG